MIWLDDFLEKGFFMQIFEINKKTKMFWFFLALPLFPREKVLRETKAAKETTIFINNGNAETNMPLKKISLSPWAKREDCYFEKTKTLSNKTHYSESCMIKGRSMTSQFFAVPPDITNTGLEPLPVASSVIALVNPAL